MSLQLLASGSGFRNFPYALRIVLLSLAVALLVDGRRRWRNRAIKDDRDSGQRHAAAWPLRPSNILIILAVGSYIYEGVYDLWWDDFLYPASAGAMIIALAFVIRQWEEESVNKIDESDLDEKTGSDSHRKE